MKKIITIILCTCLYVSAHAQKKNVKKSVPKNYTEQQAISYIEDYFKFYNADVLYSNPEARKISNNVFHVKVETCRGDYSSCYESYGIKKTFWWQSNIFILTTNSNGKYNVKDPFGF